MKVGDNWKEGLDKILKRWNRQYRGGGAAQHGVLGTHCQLRPIKSCSGKRCFDILGKTLSKTCERVHF